MQALGGVLEVGGRVLDVSVGLCPFGVLTLEWLVCPSFGIDLLVSHGVRGEDLTLVTSLHVCLQAICNPLSFLRLPVLKRETCLVFNVNFWLLIDTPASSQTFYWSLLPLKSKVPLVLFCKSFRHSFWLNCNVFTWRDVCFTIWNDLKWAVSRYLFKGRINFCFL